MAELIIRIRVWLDSYPAHKIRKIFIIIIIIITYLLHGAESFLRS